MVTRSSPFFAAALYFAVLAAACAQPQPAASPPAEVDRRGEIEAFNRHVIDATSRMDDAALTAIWEDDGVSLLPGMAPIAGKSAIGAFIAKVSADNPGAKMRSFEMTCSGVEVHGDFASEYCEEHQIVDIPGKPTFDGRGKLLYVLHRGADGVWRVRREMWNQA
jgi:ketosteroid isomerase-like protein